MNRPNNRNITDDFLRRSPQSLTFGNDIRSTFEGSETSAITPEQTQILQRASDVAEEPALTGAALPALPMHISIPGKDGFRAEFVMLMNPENLNHGKTNSISFDYTRKGYITQLWGPNQDILTSTGKTASFMVAGVGITNFFRKKSFSFLNFMALMTAYRNNGYQMLDPTDTQGVTRVVQTVSGVEIFYDNQIYSGHFNNFTMDEDAEHPYIFNYNFEFVVSTLDKNYTEVRGHFISQDEIKRFDDTSRKSKTLNDITVNGSKNPSEGMVNTYTDLVIKKWEAYTGEPWSNAAAQGFTDGSPEKNFELLRTLEQLHYEVSGQLINPNEISTSEPSL